MITGFKSNATSKINSMKQSKTSRMKAESVTTGKKSLKLKNPKQEATTLTSLEKAEIKLVIDQANQQENKEVEELKSAHDSNADGDVEFDEKDYPVITKYDADNSSSVTWLTEATSALVDQNPS